MAFPVPTISCLEWLAYSLPLLAALGVILLDCFAPARRGWILGVTVAGLALTGAALAAAWLPPQGRYFLDMMRHDRLAVLGGLLVVFTALAAALVSAPFLKERKIQEGEYYALLLFAAFGALLLTAAQELITLFLGVEILSLALYVMAGMDRRNPRSLEAGFKYFILGSMAAAFFIFGAAFLFGATGTTKLHLIAERLETGYWLAPAGKVYINPLWVYFGAILALAGLSFKLSLAPFHMWAPDVYEGAPTPVTLLIATASKVGGFVLLLRLIEALYPWALFREAIGPVLWALALISAVWGNLAALVQSDLKRMLAYSSVAHGGYLMIAVACYAWAPDAGWFAEIRSAALIYLLAYTLMKILAFGAIACLGPAADLPVREWGGLARGRAGLAAAIALAMVSLTGIPPTVGFIGKFYVFRLAIDSGLFALSLIAVLASVVSAFYYLRVVVTMYMEEKEPAPALLAALPRGGVFTLGLSAALVFLFGLAPMIFFAL